MTSDLPPGTNFMLFSRSRLAASAMCTFTAMLSASEPAKADLDGFQKTVKPFLVAHCVKCHGAEKPKGDLSLTAISGDAVGGRDLAPWATVAERLKSGDMPPDGETQPTPEAIKAVTDWIDADIADEVFAEEGAVLVEGTVEAVHLGQRGCQPDRGRHRPNPPPLPSLVVGQMRVLPP